MIVSDLCAFRKMMLIELFAKRIYATKAGRKHTSQEEGSHGTSDRRERQPAVQSLLLTLRKGEN